MLETGLRLPLVFSWALVPRENPHPPCPGRSLPRQASRSPLLPTHWLPSAPLAVLICWQVNWLINLLRNLPFSALSLARGLFNLSCSPFQENLPLVFRKFHLPGAALGPWSQSAPSRHPVSTFLPSGLLLLNLEGREMQAEGAPQAAI